MHSLERSHGMENRKYHFYCQLQVPLSDFQSLSYPGNKLNRCNLYSDVGHVPSKAVAFSCFAFLSQPSPAFLAIAQPYRAGGAYLHRSCQACSLKWCPRIACSPPAPILISELRGSLNVRFVFVLKAISLFVSFSNKISKVSQMVYEDG